jgi:nucleoid-associated protein YgaU
MNNLWLKNFLKRVRLNEATISTLLGGLVVVVVGVLIYNYFSSVNKTATEITSSESPSFALVEENGEMVPEGLPITHTVASGEDLWKISEQYYQNGYNWVDIAQENKLANANLIETGQELMIPRVAAKVVTETVASETAPLVENSEYLVQKGDNLWKISVKAYNDGYQWTKVWEANKELISNPNVIEAGMLLTLPR